MRAALASAAVGLIVATAGLAAGQERRAPPGAFLVADAPGGAIGQNRANDAATTSGERVDPQHVRATGASKITQESAAQIATTLLATAPPRNLTISVSVGAPLPGDVDVQPLPPSVTDLVPEYRGFNYAADDDRVVIVKPSTRQVVEIISAGRARP